MKKLILGNEAIALGAQRAGMSFFAAYPITPASEIMHFLAEKEGSIQFIHAEDEIAAIHMTIGASLAGCKSLTSTSGPGMSLKQEGIGLAHMMETPLVVVNVQRVGPSTGMPTLPASGDIIQSRHGSHGDYNPIVFYPSSVEECFLYAIQAFNAAEESKSPVILLSDGFLAHLAETVDLESHKVKIVKRTMTPLGSGSRHFTGLLSKDGVPQTKNYKYLKNPKSDTLLIAYGITFRVIQPLKDQYSIFKPIRIFPFLSDELQKIAGHYKRIVVIEMNDGQYCGEVEKALKREINCIPVLGGSIKLAEIEEWLNEL